MGWRGVQRVEEGRRVREKKSALLYGENDTVNKLFGNYFLKLRERELD